MDSGGASDGPTSRADADLEPSGPPRRTAGPRGLRYRPSGGGRRPGGAKRARRIGVLFVADSLMAGGIESQLVHLARGLDRATFELSVLCLYGPTVRDLHFAPELRAAGLPLYLPDLGMRARDKVRGVGQIAALAWRLRPAIIQAEGYHANLLTRLAGPLLPPRTRLVGTLRGRHSRKQMRYERLSHRLCARVAVNAPQLREDLTVDGHVPAAKIVYIPNGVPIERYAVPHDPRLRSALGAGVRRVFTSVGRVSYEKNPHWTAEAFGLLRREGGLPAGTRLLIVGPRQDDGAQALLDAAVREYGLEDVVEQRPATPHPEDYYHATDACILYSPSEGLSNVCLEALAAGRPVIISRGANAAGVVEHGVTGWVVDDASPLRLMETLAHVMALPAGALEDMAPACRRRAEQYSVPAMVGAYAALYEELAQGR